MTINREGCTRIVILIGRLAIKLPNIFSWRLTLHGLLANGQEVQFSRAGWPELCPVIFRLPLALVIVMRRAEPMDFETWQDFDYTAFCEKADYRVPAERKRDSFGILGGRIVAVDYGN